MIVAIDLESEVTGEVLVSGNDFYASPRLSPDASRLAWITWNHPNMPWDGTELWVADVNPDGTLTNSEQIAGGGVTVNTGQQNQPHTRGVLNPMRYVAGKFK